MIIISDTSVITNLAAIGHFELLPQLYREIIIPAAVYRELVEIDPPVPGTHEGRFSTRSTLLEFSKPIPQLT